MFSGVLGSFCCKEFELNFENVLKFLYLPKPVNLT